MTRTREDEALIAAGRSCLNDLIREARAAEPVDWSPASLDRMERLISSLETSFNGHLADDGMKPNPHYARIAETTASVLLLHGLEPEAADRAFAVVPVSGVPSHLVRMFRASELMRSLCDDHDYGIEDGVPILIVSPKGSLADLDAVSELVVFHFGGRANFDLAIEYATSKADSSPAP